MSTRKTIVKTVDKPRAKSAKLAKAAGVSADLDKLLRTCLLGIAELYPDDKTKPGLVLAWLTKQKSCDAMISKDGEYYASFARYEGEKKIIVAQGRGKDLQESLESLAGNWKSRTASASKLAKLAVSLNTSRSRRLGSGWDCNSFGGDLG